MKNKKIKLTENCNDWHLGWGYGGHDKIGKLTIATNEKKIKINEFRWVGYSQGRHGQRWNKGANVIFSLIDNNTDIKVISSKGNYPEISELIKTAIGLL